ncbi:NlpC/P60 family protein [Sagittula sp. NFXS13]|uniref:C40 family peptidase n=1 Tax=Sagittula sp. NFXS13 TaxID=2819095 RepID=UPI0032DED6CD
MIGLPGFDDRRCRQWNDRVTADWLADRNPQLVAVQPRAHFVATPVLDLSLDPGGRRDRQLRYGEAFDVLERRDGYAFGTALTANYVGWVDVAALRAEDARQGDLFTVSARATHVYPAPDFKCPEGPSLPHGAAVRVQQTQNRFSLTELGWVPTAHLTQDTARDPVAVAALYLGTPYLWGANSSFGIDCSGLVQAALTGVGMAAPGDSDLQERALGDTLATGTPPERGDLLFWKGHVAWVADADTLLHANAYHMATAYEPITAAIARIERQGDGPVTRHARLGVFASQNTPE